MSRQPAERPNQSCWQRLPDRLESGSIRHVHQGADVFSRLIFPMEFFIYAVNSIIFTIFIFLTGWVMISNLLVAALVAVGIGVVAAVPSLRTSASTYLSNNITMLGATMQEARGNKQLVWTKIEENRRGQQTIDASMITQ